MTEAYLACGSRLRNIVRKWHNQGSEEVNQGSEEANQGSEEAKSESLMMLACARGRYVT